MLKKILALVLCLSPLLGLAAVPQDEADPQGVPINCCGDNIGSPPAVPPCPEGYIREWHCAQACVNTWANASGTRLAACYDCKEAAAQHKENDFAICDGLYGPNGQYPDPIALNQCYNDADAEWQANWQQCCEDSDDAQASADAAYAACLACCCFQVHH